MTLEQYKKHIKRRENITRFKNVKLKGWKQKLNDITQQLSAQKGVLDVTQKDYETLNTRMTHFVSRPTVCPSQLSMMHGEMARIYNKILETKQQITLSEMEQRDTQQKYLIAKAKYEFWKDQMEIVQKQFNFAREKKLDMALNEIHLMRLGVENERT